MGLFLTFVIVVNFGLGLFIAGQLGMGPRSLGEVFRALGRIPKMPEEPTEMDG